MEEIRRVVAITPVWNESLGMIQDFESRIEMVRRTLNSRGIGFSHFFLDDGALNLPESSSILVRHPKNQGLAKTLIDGYTAALELKSPPEIVIRLDCQEHDPEKIVEIVENMQHSSIDAVFMPVYYWVRGHPRPLMKEVTQQITNFIAALKPIEKELMLSVYNQVFPLGYQAFRKEALETLLPKLKKGVVLCEEITKQPATWGLDLLSILLAGNDPEMLVDFIWGGWADPWSENRGADKIAAQRSKAETMVEVARRLGCEVQ